MWDSSTEGLVQSRTNKAQWHTGCGERGQRWQTLWAFDSCTHSLIHKTLYSFPKFHRLAHSLQEFNIINHLIIPQTSREGERVCTPSSKHSVLPNSHGNCSHLYLTKEEMDVIIATSYGGGNWGPGQLRDWFAQPWAGVWTGFCHRQSPSLSFMLNASGVAGWEARRPQHKKIYAQATLLKQTSKSPLQSKPEAFSSAGHSLWKYFLCPHHQR